MLNNINNPSAPQPAMVNEINVQENIEYNAQDVSSDSSEISQEDILNSSRSIVAETVEESTNVIDAFLETLKRLEDSLGVTQKFLQLKEKILSLRTKIVDLKKNIDYLADLDAHGGEALKNKTFECQNFGTVDILKDFAAYFSKVKYTPDQDIKVRDIAHLCSPGAEFYDKLAQHNEELGEKGHEVVRFFQGETYKIFEELLKIIPQNDQESKAQCVKYVNAFHGMLNNLGLISSIEACLKLRVFFKSLFESNPQLENLFFHFRDTQKAGIIIKRDSKNRDNIQWGVYVGKDREKDAIVEGIYKKGITNLNYGSFLKVPYKANVQLDTIIRLAVPNWQSYDRCVIQQVATTLVGVEAKPVQIFAKEITTKKLNPNFFKSERKDLLRELPIWLIDQQERKLIVNPEHLEAKMVVAILKKLGIYNLKGVNLNNISDGDAEKLKESLVLDGRMFLLDLSQYAILTGWSADEINVKGSKFLTYDEFVKMVCGKGKTFSTVDYFASKNGEEKVFKFVLDETKRDEKLCCRGYVFKDVKDGESLDVSDYVIAKRIEQKVGCENDWLLKRLKEVKKEDLDKDCRPILKELFLKFKDLDNILFMVDEKELLLFYPDGDEIKHDIIKHRIGVEYRGVPFKVSIKSLIKYIENVKKLAKTSK